MNCLLEIQKSRQLRFSQKKIKRIGSKETQQHGDCVFIDEHKRAAKVLIKLVQQQAFSQEIKVLQTSHKGKCLPSGSPLLCLDPILDLICGNSDLSACCHQALLQVFCSHLQVFGHHFSEIWWQLLIASSFCQVQVG